MEIIESTTDTSPRRLEQVQEGEWVMREDLSTDPGPATPLRVETVNGRQIKTQAFAVWPNLSTKHPYLDVWNRSTGKHWGNHSPYQIRLATDSETAIILQDIAPRQISTAKASSGSPKAHRPAQVGESVCWCGCTGATKGGRFLPGHDAKLKGMLARYFDGLAVNGETPRPEVPPQVWDNLDNLFKGRFAGHAS